MKISRLEQKHIELVYKGAYQSEDISEALNFPKAKIINKEARIFKKLSVNSWFNAIRKSFELGVLSKNKYCSLSVSAEVEQKGERLREINFSDYDNDTDIKLEIYYQLIDLYTKMEYNVLLKH